MATTKDKIIKYLRHIGHDFAEEDEEQDTSPECEGQGEEEGFCPRHHNCGICRYNYMKNKGYLNPDMEVEE